ncbi:MAG TPA: CoA transferase [Burkholderiales bacterium]|nr:CoA transferase [Burkholderiales bacterium]
MPLAALREVLEAARFDPGQAVEIAGDDPVLPIRYRVAAAGSAALGALGLAVAKLSGRRQRVRVNARAAAVSLRSARYLRVNGKPAPVWDPLSGFYPVRDGWISIHCNFPNHRGAAMRVLGSEHDRARAEEASRARHGEELEDAIHAAGGCAGFVRSHETWSRHAQAAAVAAQPLLEIARIGDAPLVTLEGARPLGGVRVLDLTRVLAGPTCAKSLAEHGAEVLKISAAHLPDSGLTDLDTGIGKLSARIDLRKPDESKILHELVRTADVFVQSYRPGALATRGFSPENLARLRPGIVCASLSAWGATGPWRERRGFDSIVQAVSGIAHASGDGAKPRLLPVSAIDYVSGYLMAFGVCVALSRRANEGGSWLVRVALARIGKWIVDRGTAKGYQDMAEDLPAAELAPLLAEMDAPDGRIRYLKPIIELSETPPHFARPPVPLGYHRPAWTSS